MEERLARLKLTLDALGVDESWSMRDIQHATYLAQRMASKMGYSFQWNNHTGPVGIEEPAPAPRGEHGNDGN